MNYWMQSPLLRDLLHLHELVNGNNAFISAIRVKGADQKHVPLISNEPYGVVPLMAMRPTVDLKWHRRYAYGPKRGGPGITYFYRGAAAATSTHA